MADSSTQNRSVYRLRWIGYGLLIFFLIDSLTILIPPQFTNAAWEIQAVGNLVDRVVVPLLGLALVFFGEYFDRGKLEPIVLKILSWLCLLLALLFFLMAPLSGISAVRINSQTSEVANQQLAQQISNLDNIERQINQGTPEQLKALAQQLKRPEIQEQLKAQGIDVNLDDPQQLKSVFLERVRGRKAQLQTQVDTALSGRTANLVKSAVKWALGALIASALFFLLWKSTDWAR